MPRTILICSTLLAGLLLAGCGGDQRPDDTALADADARAAMLAGEFGLAAKMYLKLAGESNRPQSEKWLISAAGARFNQGRIDASLALLDRIRTEDLPAPLPLRVALLRAEIALHDHRFAEVPAMLPTAALARAPVDLRQVGHLLRAQAFMDLERPIDAAGERAALDMLFYEPSDIEKNRQQLWYSLTRADADSLQQAVRPPPDTFGGWVELALINQRYLAEREVLDRALATWRTRFPGHPAGQLIVPQMIIANEALGTPPKHIALLLPLSGGLAKAAGAIRDGFLAAWYADPDTLTRPKISILDTAEPDIWLTMQEAVDAGADLVVGPLRKQHVGTLSVAAGVPIATLALNRAPTAAPAGDEQPMARSPDSLFQFSLAPEDEARNVAERAIRDGHSQVAVLVPVGAWGERVRTAFGEAFERSGGEVVQSAAFTNEPKDLSPTVAKLLGVELSMARGAALKRLLRVDLKYEPRRRQDIDFIFLAAFPRQALQLRPQIKFHHASHVPVYATSHIFTGKQDAVRDRDIDGVFFGDMPWLLDANRAQPALHQALNIALPNAPAAFQRLHAFGIDAYRLALEVRRLKALPGETIFGVTGKLSLNRDNQIERELMWARFNDGLPQVVIDE